MTQDQSIAEITRRLVDYFHPERIYLFGSAARGDGGPDPARDASRPMGFGHGCGRGPMAGIGTLLTPPRQS